MLKQCNKLLILSILLLSHNIDTVCSYPKDLCQYITKNKGTYNDFGTGISAAKISDIMLSVLDHNADYDTVGHVVAPGEMQPNSPYLLEVLIKRSLFNFAEKAQNVKLSKNINLMKESYQLALKQIMPAFKNAKIAFDEQSLNNLQQLLLQSALIKYFKSDVGLMSEIAKRKIVSKADVHTFLKYCFPHLYQSHVDIRERKDWEGTLISQNAWDRTMPQLFEVTMEKKTYVIKASWRVFEYENSRKLYDLLEKDGKTYNKNDLVSYPTKFALYNAKSSAVEIFANIKSSINILTEDTLREKFFENNSECAQRYARNEKYY
ncbi:MAG: hypothetical protein LBB29_04015, partial [Holosporaceae bacterium]|nr:hypothetical protein [Holosporaceae bacterium]